MTYPERAARRLRLPADDRSPAAARAAVRAVLAEAGLTELLDETLLLTTELATNGVVHAGTDINLTVAADPIGVRVTVTDYRSGGIDPLEAAMPEVTAEGGRGLLLVDRFASSWGTTHDATGKSIWFRIDRDPDKPPAPRPLPDLSGAESEPDLAQLAALLTVAPALQSRLPVDQIVTELLARCHDATGADGGAIEYDGGDGTGTQVIAKFGDVAATAVAVALPLTAPANGRLLLAGEPKPSWRPLAELVAERVALAVQIDRMRTDEQRRSGWLTYLAEAGELLAHSLEEHLTVALIPQLIVPQLGRWAAVHLTGDGAGLRLAALTHVEEGELEHLRARLEGAAPPLAAALTSDGWTGMELPVPRGLDGIAVPLSARGATIGVLTVGRHADRHHSSEERAVVADLAKRSALALDNARIHAERQAVAHELQAALMPGSLPDVTGVSFAAEYLPATARRLPGSGPGPVAGTEVGGDFYDATELPDHRLWVAIGDVCGKGAQAAAVTGVVRDVLRVMARDGRPLPRALELLNATLLEQPGDLRYATIASALLDRGPSGAVNATLCLSGHERPLLLRAAGGVEWVGREGTAVGLFPDVKVNPEEVRLDVGDALVFFTDGVTERRDGSAMFGHERIERAVRGAAGKSARQIATGLLEAVEAFSPESPRDDIAILVVRCDPV
ncbi:Serine phosphatase RsbU, regulator of sigma subunit [Glycomyces sambucus]|uniref:Serine phosphatase RsbU, regulator of sigma subunit n=1 Tax=Glycomyces sambucus TaxID=380244 RepID=A0A1G9H9M6_9ACTN|nr:SpoIIE family protein phosphatase [Glycomyces sambucus]SDL09143.1 Serine phosphatase RsbU, regulator of sigma subunit [Glycomyces sambucus]